jgi:hypothetical protein
VTLDLETLTTYLDDHLAGAQGALALLERLEPDPSDGLDLEGLQREIEEDREAATRLLETWGEKPSGIKRAAGWVAQQLSRPKLPDDGALGRFEALELLSLGILGKRALWRTLAALRADAAAETLPSALELERLEARANDQHERVERARLACARRAFHARPG